MCLSPTLPSLPSPAAVSAAEAAARGLESVSQRMRDFFQRNPSPSATAAANGATDAPLDPAEKAQVRELTALMAEAEGAWDTAQALAAGEGDDDGDGGQEAAADQTWEGFV